jgi:hypothetical protein
MLVLMTSQNNNQSNVQIQLMERVLSNPEYKGKYVVVLDDQVFTANTGDGARQILEKIRREHPGVTPAVTYIPDADTLILC